MCFLFKGSYLFTGVLPYFFSLYIYIYNLDRFFSSFTFQMLSQKYPIPPHSPTHPLILLGQLLLHMQLEIQPLGILVSSYCFSTYRVADHFSSLGTFSSSSIGGPLIHPIADCEPPLLCLLGPGISSKCKIFNWGWLRVS